MNFQFSNSNFQLLCLVFLIISGLFWLSFGSINSSPVALAQELPENLEDFRKIGERILDRIWQNIKGAWAEAVRIWQEVWGWIVNIFKSYIFPFFESIWKKISDFFLQIWLNILERLKELMEQRIGQLSTIIRGNF